MIWQFILYDQERFLDLSLTSTVFKKNIELNVLYMISNELQHSCSKYNLD